jgi:hypothetical protein
MARYRQEKANSERREDAEPLEVPVYPFEGFLLSFEGIAAASPQGG